MGNGKGPNMEAFEAMGYEVGQAFGAYLSGMMRGFSDFNATPQDEDEEECVQITPSAKTRIEDCRACWCSTCANIEKCIDMEEFAQTQAFHAYPCDGCRDGMRYLPREPTTPGREPEQCPCKGYVAGSVNIG